MPRATCSASSSPTWSATDATAYTYDENSNRTNRVSSTDGTGLADPYAYQQSYAYDGLDRLIGSADSKPNSGGTAWVGTNGQTWGGLDALGNWRTSGTDTDGDGVTDATQTRTHNAANEITGVSGSGATWGTPTYDAAGNLTRLPPATGSSDAYQLATYDAWNHQVGVVGYTSSNVATHTTTNKFDGLGRRISGNAGEVYFNEGWQEIETRNSAGTPTEQTIYSLRYIDAPLSRDVIGSSSTDRQWIQQDANFNVTSVADPAGAVLERYRYTPYGVRTILNESGNSTLLTSSYSQPFTFQGGREHPATGMILYNEGGNGREYAPVLGRWTSRDRAVYIDGLSFYQYLKSNPIAHTDSSGMFGSPHHYIATLIAGFKAGLSLRCIFRAAARAVMIDFDKGSQDPVASSTNQHAMAGQIGPGGPYQTPEQAEKGTNDFIAEQMKKA